MKKEFIEIKRYFFVLFLALALLGGCSKDNSLEGKVLPPVEEKDDEPSGVAKQLLDAKWEVKEISDAITWKYFHFNDLFAANQYVTVFEIDLNNDKLSVDIPYVRSGFLKTSDAAINTKANAAINGSYFDTSKGGSTVFFKKDGEIIATTRNGFNPFREDVGFAIDASGKISVIRKPVYGWASVGAKSLLVSGPLLVFAGKEVSQLNETFNTTRHPRTAVGVTEGNRLIVAVVDGRATESAGMTTKELATLMHALGCKEAMNLDGGGSSTAWVKNRGVVNHPTDNKKFDHLGERGVATAIVFVEE